MLPLSFIIQYADLAAHPVTSLTCLQEMGEKLSRQAKYIPRSDCIEKLQSEEKARGQHLTRHMRAILIDWMVEVSVEYK